MRRRHRAASRSGTPSRPSAVAARRSSTPTAGAAIAQALGDGGGDLLGLWGDGDAVHMALRDEAPRDIASSRCACADGRFPSVGALPPAGDPARARDPRSLRPRAPIGAPDPRPWLDHGALGRARAARRAAPAPRREPAAYAFLPARGRGPAPDSGRPGACRHHRARPFPLHRQRRDRGAAGGAARLRPQGHRSPDDAAPTSSARAQLAGAHLRRQHRRLCASPSPARSRRRSASRRRRARDWLRALMAELERLANHLGDIGAICNDAVVRADACPLRHPARARAARRRDRASATG